MARLLKSAPVQWLMGQWFTNYFRFVTWTSPMANDLEPVIAEINKDLPVIFTFWHGEQFLIPTIGEKHFRVAALVSRHGDGSIQAEVLKNFGVKIIRGSGGRNRKKTLIKGGVRGSLEILSALEDGLSICMTANVPGIHGKVGKGVIALAKHSGRPIYPISHVTNRNIFIDTWDNSAINLPFSKSALLVGKPIWVDCAADENTLEAARQALEDDLHRITTEARRLVGKTGNKESN